MRVHFALGSRFYSSQGQGHLNGISCAQSGFQPLERGLDLMLGIVSEYATQPTMMLLTECQEKRRQRNSVTSHCDDFFMDMIFFFVFRITK